MGIEQNEDVTTLASSLRIVEVNPRQDQRWENLVNTLPQGLIYHHPAWLEVLEEAYKYQPLNLACEDANGQLLGIFPLSYTQGLLSGRRLSSLPRTPVAGPLARNNQALSLLVREAIERTRALPGTQFQIKMLANSLDGLEDGLKDLVGQPFRETYQLTLPERPELLRFGNSRNHAQIKRAVNKAAKQNIEICPAETESELREWYNFYLETMRTVVVPPRPYRFFAIAWERLQPRGLLRLLLAKHSEAGRTKSIAGLLLLMGGQTVFYAFSGWRREDQALRPNDALHWRAIHDACADGYRYYDFGEVPKSTPGLAEFKSKWGTERKWLYRYYYPTPRESEIGILDANGPLTQLSHATWQHIPLKATAILGDLAHRLF